MAYSLRKMEEFLVSLGRKLSREDLVQLREAVDGPHGGQNLKFALDDYLEKTGGANRG